MKVRISKEGTSTNYWLWCPGCDDAHLVSDTWGFNGDAEKPTFSPSILVTAPGMNARCHSFLRDGMWQFLADCDHKLAGQTVPMVDLPDWLTGEETTVTENSDE